MANPHRAAGRADQLYVRKRDSALLLRDAALDVALRVRPDVLLDHHHMLDQELVVVRKYAQHAAFLALVPPRDYFHVVVAADIDSLLYSANSSHDFDSFGNFVICNWVI